MDFGVNYFLIILSVIVGAILGGIIVFLLDFFFKGLEREGQLAMKNKIEIYEPLLNAIEKIQESIKFYQVPGQIDVRKENPLTFWEELPPSIRRNTPKDITDLLLDFSEKFKEYFYLYLEAGKILRFSIRDALKKRRQELVVDDQELKVIEAKLYDSYSSDFYTGRILSRKHSYELENLLKIKNPEYIEDYKMIPMSIFNEICSYIQDEKWTLHNGFRQHQWMKEFKESQNNLLKIIEKLKKILEEKIDYIAENYENRYSILHIIKTHFLSKRIDV
ncbi:MAG: hypothetical protein ACUVXA_08850 [Candidatus Jordarchaeum sp.]|uniref:hypothetical protein n=1 Tax=Candidatus Jordarchaeum sp. TaxID=2823881 RepID=UPI00404A79A7